MQNHHHSRSLFPNHNISNNILKLRVAWREVSQGTLEIQLFFDLLLFNQVGLVSDLLVNLLCWEGVGTQHGEADTVLGKEEDLPAFTIQISNLRIALDRQLQNTDV